MTSYEERLAIFEKELELILDRRIREFTKLCLMKAPDYIFENCPASSTGKYHPLDELSWDGNIIHIKKCFTLCYSLSRAFGIEEYRDELLASALIHDILKQGKKKTGHTVKNHPQLSVELIDNIQKESQMLKDKSYHIIRNCCGYHYGLWSSGQWKKDLSEYTMEELCFYIADYVVSKREVQVNYRRM